MAVFLRVSFPFWAQARGFKLFPVLVPPPEYQGWECNLERIVLAGCDHRPACRSGGRCPDIHSDLQPSTACFFLPSDLPFFYKLATLNKI